jgi:hypothetical protein
MTVLSRVNIRKEGIELIATYREAVASTAEEAYDLVGGYLVYNEKRTDKTDSSTQHSSLYPNFTYPQLVRCPLEIIYMRLRYGLGTGGWKKRSGSLLPYWSNR